jgi:hypothetical protein
VVMSVWLLRDAFISSASELAPMLEVGYLFALTFAEQWASSMASPEVAVVAAQPPAADGFSSPPILKMMTDICSTFMMHLGGVAGWEILWHCQGLTPLVEGGGGFEGSPANSGDLEIVWVLGGASCIFQVS